MLATQWHNQIHILFAWFFFCFILRIILVNMGRIKVEEARENIRRIGGGIVV